MFSEEHEEEIRELVEDISLAKDLWEVPGTKLEWLLQIALNDLINLIEENK